MAMTDTDRINIEAAYYHAAYMLRILDANTFEHCSNVGDLLVAFCAHTHRFFSFGENNLYLIRMTGFLHDVGKITIPRRVLVSKKQFHEKSNEWKYYISPHTIHGWHLVRRLPKVVQDAVRFHHERPDGKGYPSRFSGKRIPEIARTLSFFDAIDAMLKKRRYKKFKNFRDCIQDLRSNLGKQFDEEVYRDVYEWLQLDPAAERMFNKFYPRAFKSIKRSQKKEAV